MALTTRTLAAMKPGTSKAGGGQHGAGRLVAYAMRSGGVSFYFRYTLPNGKRDSLPIGKYDPRGRDGLTLQEASNYAGELSRRYQAGERDLRAILEAEQVEAERARAAAAEEASRKSATLGRLLESYCDGLERAGKTSAHSTRRALHLHVRDAWPTHWNRLAADITLDDLIEIIARLVAAEKRREAGKLRSYLRAAYTAAVAARQKPDALPALRELAILSNPARDLATIDGGTGTPGSRALSVDELRAYWKQIQVMPDPSGALLRFHLLTGAQRQAQLARLTLKDWDQDANTIRIWDGKGRRVRAREHVIPLLPDAAEALRAMAPIRTGPYLFTVTNGDTGAVHTTVRNRIIEAYTAMAEEKELPGGPFTAGSIRRTVVTRLAQLGISSETRAQLLSHGLGGVQQVHYDRHDYANEKLSALETLYRLLIDDTASVTPIRREA